MNHCENCNVDIVGNKDVCPLCKNKVLLQNYEDTNVFPIIKTVYESYKSVLMALFILSILICVVSIFINVLIPVSVPWSSFVLLGVISTWLIILFYINKKKSLPNFLFFQSLILTVLAVAWDYATGWHGWSIDYVLPTVYAVNIVAMYFIGKVLRIKPNEVIFYLIFGIILGFIPLVLILTDSVSIILPSVISILIANTFLVTIVIFEWKNMINELKRRLHM